VGILRGAEHLSVLPPGKKTVEDEEKGIQPRVYVMAGGGSGELLMRALADAHVPFVAGPLNIGDSDYSLALRLANNVITEQPYAPISPASLEQIRTSLLHVSLLIVCPMPIGPGNLALLQEALAAAQQGLPVLLLAPSRSDVMHSAESPLPPDDELLQHTGITERDYTGGVGVTLVRELLQEKVTVAESIGEALEIIRRYAVFAHNE
jgi:iron complex transport system ATP-binding protein